MEACAPAETPPIENRPNQLHLIPACFAVSAIIALACRVHVAVTQGANHWAALLPGHTRMDSLFFGVLLSYMFWFQRSRFDLFAASRWLPFFGLLCLIPWLFADLPHSEFMFTAGFTLNYLGFGAWLVWMLTVPAAAWMSPLAAIGRYSYSIYIWHVFAGLWLRRYFEQPAESFWFLVCYFVFALLLGMLTARLIEFPVLALRDRLTADPRPHSGAGGSDRKPVIASA